MSKGTLAIVLGLIILLFIGVVSNIANAETFSGSSDWSRTFSVSGNVVITLHPDGDDYDLFVFLDSNPYYGQASESKGWRWLYDHADYHSISGGSLDEYISFSYNGNIKVIVKWFGNIGGSWTLTINYGSGGGSARPTTITVTITTTVTETTTITWTTPTVTTITTTVTVPSITTTTTVVYQYDTATTTVVGSSSISALSLNNATIALVAGVGLAGLGLGVLLAFRRR